MILITGATGFVGKHLTARLLEKDLPVRALLRPGSRTSEIQDSRVEKTLGNPFNQESLQDALRDVDTVIHCAGALKGLRYDDYYRGNVLYTRNLLQAAQSHAPGLKKFIFISSQAAAGPSENRIPKQETDPSHPMSFYGLSKKAAEQEVEQSGLPYIILRPSSIYGPGDTEFYPLFKMAKNGFHILPGNGKNQVNLLYIRDFIQAIELALETAFTHEIYHLCGEGIFSQEEILKMACDAAGKKGVTLKVPEILARGFGRVNTWVGNLTGKPMLLNADKIKEVLQEAWLLDASKAKTRLSFSPEMPAPQGFAKTYAWYHQEGWL